MVKDESTILDYIIIGLGIIVLFTAIFVSPEL